MHPEVFVAPANKYTLPIPFVPMVDYDYLHWYSYGESIKLGKSQLILFTHMHDQIKESDWKVFKKLYPLALERFYDRVVNEFQKIATEGEISSKDRYHEIYETVQKRDKKLADLFDRAYRRSTAFIQLVSYYREDLITKEELNQLSDENRNKILSIVEDEQL